MGRVIHFEITASDIIRARKFYELFGWKITDASMPGMEYWLAKTGAEGTPGIDGAIMLREGTAQPVRVTISVDDIDTTMEMVKTAGGGILGEKQTIPGVGFFVNAHDTEGNQFGILQETPH